MNGRNRALAVARSVTVVTVCAAVVVPILAFAATSFLKRRAVIADTLVFGDLTLVNYRQLFSRVDLLGLLATSTLLAVLSSVGAILIGTAASYFVSRGGGRLPDKLYLLCLSVWFVPPVALSLEIYLWFQRFGLYDTFWGVGVLYAILHASLLVVLLAPSWDAIPRRVDEAAWIEGWSGFQVIARIHLPAVGPLLASGTALAFVRAWNELLLASILTDRHVEVLPVALVGLTTGSHVSWGQLAALGTIALLPAPLALLAVWSVVRGDFVPRLKGGNA